MAPPTKIIVFAALGGAIVALLVVGVLFFFLR
jgi:hypothetical protein